MTDILLRNVDDAVIEQIDRKAAAVGVSRAAFLRRMIEQEARRDVSVVDVSHFDRFTVLAADLGDPVVMDRAWD